MEGDFAEQPKPSAEVNKMQEWSKTTTDNLVEAKILAEVNEVYRVVAPNVVKE